METCKVEFISESEQKIILDFNLTKDGHLDYKPSFEPKIVDPKINLGLAGQLCEIFLTALISPDNQNQTITTKNENLQTKLVN